MPTPTEILLLRASDQFVAGLAWTGYELETGPRLRASGAAPRQLTLVLPPQSVGEGKFDADDDTDTLRGARLSGPARLSFSIADAEPIELLVDSLLLALQQRAVLMVEGDAASTIELPWRLPLTPRSADGSPVLLALAPTARQSDAGVTGLWVLRIDAAGQLRLQPRRPNGDDAGLDVAPLSGAERQMIFDAASADPDTWARCKRLELSALGGWLDAGLAAPGLSWAQQTSMGRDSSVQISVHGVLYPTGHRAVYVNAAKRMLPAGSMQAAAALQREQHLIVAAPQRLLDRAPLAVRRQFPFASIELLPTSMSGMQLAEWRAVPRLVKPFDDLRVALEKTNTALATLRAEFQPGFDEAPHSLPAYIQMLLDLGLAPGEALMEARIRANLDPDLMQRERHNAELQRRQAHIQLDLALQEDPRDQDRIDMLDATIAELDAILNGHLSQASIDQARAELPMWRARLEQLEQEVAQAFAAQDTLDEFIVNGFPEHGAQLRQLLDTSATLQQRIKQLELGLPAPPSHFLPTALDGQPFLFTMRCHNTVGEVLMSMPLVFVADRTLPAGDHVDELSFTSDPETLAAVDACWLAASGEGRGHVRLPAIPVDLVHDAGKPARAGDVHPVHTLALRGALQDGAFWPQVAAMEVELPALRSLVPEVDPRQWLQYSPGFAHAAAIPDMPLRFAKAVGIDFRQAADRAGGLVSPSFTADGIAREFGVAAAAAVPRALNDAVSDLPDFDPRGVFKDATLLGLPLSSLIAIAAGAQPPPPNIVQLFKDQLPFGVEMSWSLALQAFGPFRPLSDATRLEVTVRRTPAELRTDGALGPFQFVLPGGDSEATRLLTLEFGGLRFIQRSGQPSRLEIPDFKVGFGGALQLLRELQEALQGILDVGGARIDRIPNGISASYALEIPHLPAAGCFVIENIAISTSVMVPFDARPVTFSLAFASRDKPFHVTVLAFGGGGYIDVTLGPEGLHRLEAAIEFGAMISVDFLVARGEVHALGGVRFIEDQGSIEIDGYLDIGGMVEVLGLISVSIALVIALHYESAGNRLVGSARIVIELDLTLFSQTLSIDSGEWVLAGSAEPAPPESAVALPDAALEAASAGLLRTRWADYLNAYATP